MKRAFSYGVGSLAVISLIAFINMGMFQTIVSLVGGICLVASALLLRTMIGVGPRSSGVTAQGEDDPKDKRLGMHIGIFGLPYLVTTVLFLL
ncbi:hypothetical protein [Salimicrobium halophilum]|uniref:DUF5316 domain-containing protein n=1 Tax=Salimicrobium halophilum TaxID=86666 RepID=A0A1G8RAZ5_9BACI|nr:hypothetical protein [Salimicrobium halophilum]SDJ14091.1 hypothetical protein SAMN04490247_0928 [Salimicrobium halophilum]